MADAPEPTIDYSGAISEIEKFANSGRHVDAIKTACDKAPLRAKEQSVKDSFSKVVSSVLNEVKEPDIPKIVGALSADQNDTLVKFIYKALETTENSVTLLKWHAEATKKGGIGSIVRAISERRTL
eukprot:TRINITY_DN66363_c0_g1_i1.p1 TRINITY_DN66363_c0_g1~~TRINITY_DN66363_c0_g1_i1.p1  ORF type:complete len:126 (+),score=26.33 TRINITY_DN66363_c0_g1_i1:42-419(+)